MKKRGFTLAEVLITLSIVGVVAALTIPTFVANTRNKANASKLSTVITAVENAYTTMMADEGVSDLTETTYYINISESKITDAMTELSKFIKISSSKTDEKKCICITKNGAELEFEFKDSEASETDAKNAGFASLASIGTLLINVDNKSPLSNKDGRIKFKFHIGTNGLLHPAGGKAYTLLDTSAKTWDQTGDYECKDGKVTIGCTARLIEEGFQVNY